MDQGSVSVKLNNYYILQQKYILNSVRPSQIGMRFAMMETKTGLAEILSKFEVMPCEDTQIPIKTQPRSILLTPNVPIRLTFRKL